MISSLHGNIIHKESGSLVIELGGLGLQVFVPASLAEQVRLGDRLLLYTYLVVRQDALTLYGFENPDGREIFTQLLTVNGVGPRVAMSILSALDPHTIRRAVFHEQSDLLSRVPGVGKKTAQKILLQLHDRIKAVEGLAPVAAMSEVDAEILEALTGLGYSVVEAQAAIQHIPSGSPEEISERLRLALTYFARP
jgi:Holliday junction DNA helicase RuvA